MGAYKYLMSMKVISAMSVLCRAHSILSITPLIYKKNDLGTVIPLPHLLSVEDPAINQVKYRKPKNRCPHDVY